MRKQFHFDFLDVKHLKMTLDFGVKKCYNSFGTEGTKEKRK